MKFNKRQLKKEADKFNYTRDTYEKVIRLVDILAYIQSVPFLFNNLALKGGTAINLTIFDLPRLSVDIDLDFTSHVTKNEMLIIRQKITNLLKNYLEKNDYILGKESRHHYALDSFKIYYINSGNNKDSIKIEINYILRNHVYNPIVVKSKDYGMIKNVLIRTLHPHEIYGSKFIALMTRATPRDLYDILYMINSHMFNEHDIQEIKKCAVFYRAISNEDGNYDFNLNRLDSISQNHIKRFLLPVINSKEFFSLSLAKKQVIDFFNKYFMLSSNEVKFLKQFQNNNYCPELLFSNVHLKNIQNHPMALWKTSSSTK